MIVRLTGQPEHERCTSPDYVSCPAAKQHAEDRPTIDHCPFLQESLVQYCAAAAVIKYIPYSESVLSRCGTDSHKYCELYLTLADPSGPGTNSSSAGRNETMHIQSIDDILMPSHLYYSPNHMWMEVGCDGICHIGVDAFLAKVFGSVDHITFVTTKGYHRPTVSFSVQGVDMQLVFPISLNITNANTYLRTNPEKIFTDPYSIGWLFETTFDQTKQRNIKNTGLIPGDAVHSWMKTEIDKMNSFAHRISSQPDMRGAIVMADGGLFAAGLAKKMEREDILKLFNDFFSPLTVWNAQQ